MESLPTIIGLALAPIPQDVESAIWSNYLGKEMVLSRLYRPLRNIDRVSFSGDGRLCVVNYYRSHASVVITRTGLEAALHVAPGDTDIFHAQLSRDGQKLFKATFAGSWTTQRSSGELEASGEFFGLARMSDVIVSPNLNAIVLVRHSQEFDGSQRYNLRIFTVAPNTQHDVDVRSLGYPYSFALSQDGKYFYTFSASGVLEMASLPALETVGRVDVDGFRDDAPILFDVAHDNFTVAALQYGGYEIAILEPRLRIQNGRTMLDPRSRWRRVDARSLIDAPFSEKPHFSPDGKYICVLTYSLRHHPEPTLVVFDFPTMTVHAKWHAQSNSYAFTADSKHVMYVDQSGGIVRRTL